MASNTKTCIYCDQARPFTGEHVFPAGMGGDDPSYILRELVCKHCNTDVFSPLEAQLMRNSPFALAHIHKQLTGRDRGINTKAPTIEHASCVYVDESGFLLEAHMVAGMRPMTLPQIQISGDEVRTSGESYVELGKFFEELQVLLGDSVEVIEKRNAEGKVGYEVTAHLWDGHDYRSNGATRQLKPPKSGVWFESLTSAKEQENYWPRIFKRHRGQIVLRVREPSHVACFLSGVKCTLPSLAMSQNITETAIERPLVNVGMAVQPQKIMRALAKICVNFVCHEYGDALVRSYAFDPIRQSIMRGGGDVPVMNAADLNQIFSNDKRDIHLVVLLPVPSNGSVVLTALVRLYGGGVQMLKLAEVGELTSDLEPVAFEVHYLENKIERISYVDYLRNLLFRAH